MGRTKGGLNAKLTAVVDALGRAVGFNLAPGPQHDLRACAPLQSTLYGRWAFADRGFDSDAFRQGLARTGTMVCIPPRSRRLTDCRFSRDLCRHAIKSKTSLAESNAISISPRDTRSLPKLFSVSSFLPRCSTGSLTRFEAARCDFVTGASLDGAILATAPGLEFKIYLGCRQIVQDFPSRP
jgi:hypothetical protein